MQIPTSQKSGKLYDSARRGLLGDRWGSLYRVLNLERGKVEISCDVIIYTETKQNETESVVKHGLKVSFSGLKNEYF